jgi:tRNA A37 threonylcarbamoyladenosine dehydratase
MMDERFSRLGLMIGEKGLERLSGSFAAVVGLGAVGSYAVEALARSGVGRLRLVDFDVLRPSNVNRQLLALESTLGLPKAEAARRRVLDINPACRVEAIECFVHAESLDRALGGPPGVLVDAIDSLGPKAQLIAGALRRGIPLVSCMGAALRTDPLLVRTGPFSSVKGCPLAARLRPRLRRLGVPPSFACVHSVEPLGELRKAVSPEPDLDGALSRGRSRRPFGSLPTVTGIFGLTAANEALRVLLGDLFPAAGKCIDPG